MTHINLLPWREQKRDHEKQVFTILMGGTVVFSFFIIFLINHYASGLVSNQTIRNKMLEDEIAILDNQIKEIKNLETLKHGLISRMNIVKNLQSTRTLMVHLFDELIKITPNGIYLKEMEGKNNSITISGFAESNTYVSQTMKNIENDKWLYNPVLSEIKKSEDKEERSANNEFKLTFSLGAKNQSPKGQTHD